MGNASAVRQHHGLLPIGSFWAFRAGGGKWAARAGRALPVFRRAAADWRLAGFSAISHGVVVSLVKTAVLRAEVVPLVTGVPM